MDTQNPSAPAHAQARITGKNHPRRRTHAPHHPSGVIHENSRHTNRFTVIGNHLAQHQELSGLAIGLGVHIQSLPTGTPVDIKTLAARFPEGPTRIAGALRELETHGYLRRTRVRTESGRIVTRTVSCNQPGRHGDAPADAPMPTAGTPARRTAEQRKKPPRRALPAVPQPGYSS
ncbi:helix-turn-helix domain-containing protein, partial [Streptomyces scabiei]|nr:helix-turn-helix domain-containing protein [Streptomyces scabiei]